MTLKASAEVAHSRASHWTPEWAWFLVAIGPVVFAIATWDVSNRGPALQHWLRDTGAPLACIELIVSFYALRRGLNPIRVIGRSALAVRLALGALIAIASIDAALVAIDPAEAATRTILSLIHLLFGLAAAHLARIESRWPDQRVWNAVLLGLIWYSVILVLFVLIVPDARHFNWRFLGLAVSNVRHLGFFAAVGASIALARAATAESRRVDWGAVFCGAAMFVLAFWSGTRGAVFAVWAAFVALAVILPVFRSLRSIGALVFSTLLGLQIAFLLPVPNGHYGIGRIVGSLERGSLNGLSSDRLLMWRLAWDAIGRHPLFGYGQGQFGLVITSFKAFYSNPHNALLQVVFDWGVIGAGCFALLTVYVVHRCWNNLKFDTAGNVTPALVAASLLTLGLYDGSLYHTYPLSMISLALGFMASRPAPRLPHPSPATA